MTLSTYLLYAAAVALLIVTPGPTPDDERTRASGRSIYLQGCLVGASNPKAVLFFAAFFPQFLNPAAPIVPQFASA